MELKLSVIVPIYNVEKYLRKCVDSLLQQDLSPEEYEIILVDDGSPDQCGIICEEYAARFAQVKVIHRENGGLSAARNSGIERAKGQYVQFVDSDDYLESNVLKAMVGKMDDDDLDILRFNYQNVNEKYEVFAPNKDPKRWVDYSDSICDGLTFLNERLGPPCYVWQFIVKRTLLNDKKDWFKEGIYFEDTEWTPRIILQSKRVTSVDMVAYNYLIRQGSITQSVDEGKKRKVLNDKMLLIDSIKEQMQKVQDKRWFEGMISLTVTSILAYVAENFYKERWTIIKALQSKDVFPLSKYMANQTGIRRIKLINISPILFCVLLKVLKD